MLRLRKAALILYNHRMKEIGSIRVFEDQEFLRRIVIWSFAVCIVCAPVLVAAYLAFPGLEGNGLPGPLESVVAVVVASMVSFVLHEAVHAVFFKLFAPAGARITFGANWKSAMLFTCAEGIVYTRHQYLVVALAPTLVVTLLLLAFGAMYGAFFELAIAAVIHLSGCVGDWGYVQQILRNPSITHVEDTDFGVRFFGE